MSAVPAVPAPSAARARRRVRALVFSLVLALLLAGCSGQPRRVPPPLADQVSGSDRNPQARLTSELKSEILDGYERDAPPDLETAMLPVVGAARIGVGPGDFLLEQELANASSRWPLTIDPAMTTHVRSKHLDLHLSKDGSAAWMFDEISWRLDLCGHTLVIPLRQTALYARDGDRWVPVFEHLSWGAALTAEAPVLGRSVPSAAVSTELDAALETSLAPLLQAPLAASPLVSTGAEALLVGPDWSQEWHGPDLVGKVLSPSKLELEDRRAGVVGLDVAQAQVAYWVGNLRTAGAEPRRRLRATFVFERRGRAWVVVQGHVSAPVDDETLAQLTVGSALTGLNPLRVQCQIAGW